MDLREHYSRKDIDYSGKNVTTYSFGTGRKKIFCFPPFPHSGLAYLRFLEMIPENEFNFITLDIPGWIGYSENLFEKRMFKYERMLEVINHLIKTLEIDEFSLLGYSFGTSLSVLLNNEYNNRINKVVLVSPLINGKVVKEDPMIQGMRLLKKYELYPIASMYVRSRFKTYRKDLASLGYPEYLLNEYDMMLNNLNAKVELDSIYELFTSDFSKYLDKLQKKDVLILVGDHDMPAVKQEALNLLSLLPNARSQIFKGPHEAFLLRPQKKILNIVQEFLKG